MPPPRPSCRRGQKLPFQDPGRFGDLLFAGQMCHARGGGPRRRRRRRRRSGGSSASPLSIRFSTSPLSLYNDILFASIASAASTGGGGGATMGATERASEWRCYDDAIAIAVARSSRIPSSFSLTLLSLFHQTITAGARLRLGKLKGSIHCE